MTQGPLFDLARVEVLKGPQGTLYGQNSTGGAINYITAKPTEHFSTGFSASFGRFETFQGQAFVSGPLAQGLSARLAVDTTLSGDWQYSYLRDDSIGAQKKAAVRLLLDWQPIEAVHGSFNFNGWTDRSDNQVPQFIVAIPRVPANVLPALLTLPTAPANPRAADWDPNTDFARNNRQGQAVARFDIDLGRSLTLTSLSNYVYVRINSRYDNDGTAFNLADVTTTGHVDVFSQEFRLAAPFAQGRGNFLLGVNYQTDHDQEGSFQRFNQLSSTVNVSSPPLPPPGLGTINQSENRGTQSNRSAGVFSDLEWNLTDQFTILGGARYTDTKHNNRSCTADTGNGDWAHVANGLLGLFTGAPGTLMPGQCVTIASDFTTTAPNESFSEHNVSWRAGLNFKPTHDSLLYLLASRGFKAGNYPIINAIARSSLRPVTQEQLTSFEVGYKTQVASMLRVDGAVYYYEYRNKQLLTNTADPVFGLVPTLGNVPRSHSYGADLDLVLTPFKGLTLQSAAAYQQTHIGPFQDYDVFGTPVSLDGHRFNFAPAWTVNGDGEYRFPVSGAHNAFVGANVTYNSTTYSDLAQSPALQIKPFTTLGLRAGVAAIDGRWQAMVWGRNVANEYYWTNAALGYDGLFRLSGRPATFGVSVSYKPY
jgi:iron complex outermembrane receptor protein